MTLENDKRPFIETVMKKNEIRLAKNAGIQIQRMNETLLRKFFIVILYTDHYYTLNHSRGLNTKFRSPKPELLPNYYYNDNHRSSGVRGLR